MKHISFLALPTLVVLAGCSGMPEVPSMPSMSSISSVLTPYHIDVRQGNFVTQEMMAQIKVGQSKDQVRYILGTPLVTDMFHADRWDYIYRFQPGRGEVQQRRMAVYFSDGKLLRVSGDVVTSDRAVAPPATPDSQKTEPVSTDSGKEAMKLESSMAAPVVQ